MIQLSGATAQPSPHQFDEEAFDELSEFADTVRTAFDQNALDRALDRLVARPERQSSGRRLARRLFRDAQKFLKVNRKQEYITDELEAENRGADEPRPLDLFEIREAVATIRTGLLSLSIRDRRLFLIRMTSSPSTAVGVGDRQFRTLLGSARRRLGQQDRIDDALSIVLDALGRWRWETIALLGPLDCLTPAN